MSIGTKLRALRAQTQKTQQQVADDLNRRLLCMNETVESLEMKSRCVLLITTASPFNLFFLAPECTNCARRAER